MLTEDKERQFCACEIKIGSTRLLVALSEHHILKSVQETRLSMMQDSSSLLARLLDQSAMFVPRRQTNALERVT